MFNAQEAVVKLLKNCLFVGMLDSELGDHLVETKQTLREFRVAMMVEVLTYERNIKCKR